MAVPNILADITILCMPIRQVWKLQLDRRSKVALTFIFLLGSFVCVASIIRVTALFQIDNADPTSNWSSLEFALAVVSASLPTLRPLVLKLRPTSWKGAVTKDSHGSGPSDRQGGSHKEGVSKQRPRDEFLRLPDGGTEAFAVRHTPTDLELGDRQPNMKNGIMVTNVFSTTSHR
ncbi:MAG: hypothetical protein Q9187_007339 [Circinaria calcarea]